MFLAKAGEGRSARKESWVVERGAVRLNKGKEGRRRAGVKGHGKAAKGGNCKVGEGKRKGTCLDLTWVACLHLPTLAPHASLPVCVYMCVLGPFHFSFPFLSASLPVSPLPLPCCV